MNRKEIILQLGNGSLKGGFPTVNVELKGDDFDGWKGIASLSPNTELESAYQEWLQLYQMSCSLKRGRGIKVHGTGRQFSFENTLQTTLDLIAALNRWLNQGGLADIQSKLRTSLQVDDRISLSIITDDGFLWKLPWHQWDFITDYKYCVESFSKSSVQSNRQRKLRANGRVDILGIWGNNTGLGLEKDLAALRQPHAKVVDHYPRSALEISNIFSKQKQIRILFFGGHGDTIELELAGGNYAIGKIQLDTNIEISIKKIKEDLSAAIERGLQIAIFNCCSGWGLAQELANLNIPYLIVMRYKISDELAQQFCSDLLGTYSQGGDFTAAFHHARSRLVRATDRGDEFDSWLPMLVHNPESQKVTWADLSRSWWQKPAPEFFVKARRELTKPDRLPLTWIGISLLSTAITMYLQTLAPVKELESNVVGVFQSAQAHLMPVKSHVIVVNVNRQSKGSDNVIEVIPKEPTTGEFIIDEAQLEDIRLLPFSALGLDLQVQARSSNSWLENRQRNISINCEDPSLKIEDRSPKMNYAAKIGNCPPLAWAITDPTRSINRSVILNPDLKLDPPIELGDIIKKNPAIFKDKIILVGFVENASSSVLIHALAAEQKARSIDSYQPLLTSYTDSIGNVYLLLWAGISAISIFRVRRSVLITIVITGCSIGAGWLLFMNGYLLPLVPAAIVVSVSSYLVYLVRSPNESM